MGQVSNGNGAISDDLYDNLERRSRGHDEQWDERILHMRRWSPLLAMVVLAVSACGSATTTAAPPRPPSSSSTPGSSPTGPNDLPKTLLTIDHQPKHEPSDSSYIG